MRQSRLETLGGSFWQGSVCRDAKGRRVQDAWVHGIRPEAHRLAIRMVGAKARRVMSLGQKAALEKSATGKPANSVEDRAGSRSRGLERIGSTGAVSCHVVHLLAFPCNRGPMHTGAMGSTGNREENMKRPRSGANTRRGTPCQASATKFMAMRCSVSVAEVRRLVAEQHGLRRGRIERVETRGFTPGLG